MYKLTYTTTEGKTHTALFATLAPYLRAKKMLEAKGYAIK